MIVIVTMIGDEDGFKDDDKDEDDDEDEDQLGVEQNRKQEFSSFQELLDFVPATFSPSCSAGPLLVLAFCFKYNAT